MVQNVKDSQGRGKLRLYLLTFTLLCSFLAFFKYSSPRLAVSPSNLSDNRSHNISEPWTLPPSLTRRSDWPPFEQTDFCKALIKNPIFKNPSCNFDPTIERCSGSSVPPSMFSQFYQDYYIYKHHFKYLKRPGIYADIATNHPYLISNSYFFDHCLKWGGLCVEANYRYFEGIHRHRSCKLVPTCVSSTDNLEIEFAIPAEGGLGGIIDDTYKNTRRLNIANSTEKFSTRCTTMKNVTSMYGLSEIDFLSLDVEGHELDVLKGFDLPNFTIKIMTIEGTASSLNSIGEYLSTFGYTRHVPISKETEKGRLMLAEDAIFVHSSVTFGAPV